MKSQIEKLYDETSALLSQLNNISIKNGILLDNDLQNGLFMLLLDDDYHEMKLVKHRVETAIKQISDGTFKIKNVDESLKIDFAA